MEHASVLTGGEQTGLPAYVSVCFQDTKCVPLLCLLANSAALYLLVSTHPPSSFLTERNVGLYKYELGLEEGSVPKR